MRINVTNEGGSEIYIETVRFVPEWADLADWYATSIGRYVPPGEEVPIGLLGFSGPPAAGTYDYHFEVDLMAKVERPLGSVWADIAPATHDTFQLEVLPVTPVGGYPQYMNDKDVYRKVNDLIQPDDTRVAQLADDVSAGLGDEYNIYWVASLFDWVLEELEYRSDPSDNDVWSPAGATCDSRSGDCEDFSILISSVVEHWGGNSRFYIITGHAFAGVYVGGPQMDTLAVANALNAYYGTSTRFCWFKDDLGYWIIADGTSSQYLGGLPYGGVAVDDQGGWDISGTDYLYITDIYPDYPE
jgi:transglutaminase-like putative cysteine protease